jgi:hypothetical protein
MEEGMVARKLACKEAHMVVGTLVCKELGMVVRMEEGMVVRMEEGMVAHKLACKEVHMVVGTLACKEVRMVVHMVEDMVVRVVEGMAHHMEEDMAVVRMVEDNIVVCKVLDIQACMVGDIRVCKVHKLEGMVRNSRQNNGWNSLSTRVPRHPKKATRLIFPVVFSLKDSLCLGLVYIRIFRKISQKSLPLLFEYTS